MSGPTQALQDEDLGDDRDVDADDGRARAEELARDRVAKRAPGWWARARILIEDPARERVRRRDH